MKQAIDETFRQNFREVQMPFLLIYTTDEGPLVFYQSLEEVSVDLQI